MKKETNLPSGWWVWITLVFKVWHILDHPLIYLRESESLLRWSLDSLSDQIRIGHVTPSITTRCILLDWTVDPSTWTMAWTNQTWIIDRFWTTILFSISYPFRNFGTVTRPGVWSCSKWFKWPKSTIESIIHFIHSDVVDVVPWWSYGSSHRFTLLTIPKVSWCLMHTKWGLLLRLRLVCGCLLDVKILLGCVLCEHLERKEGELTWGRIAEQNHNLDLSPPLFLFPLQLRSTLSHHSLPLLNQFSAFLWSKNVQKLSN